MYQVHTHSRVCNRNSWGIPKVHDAKATPEHGVCNSTIAAVVAVKTLVIVSQEEMRSFMHSISTMKYTQQQQQK